MTTAATAAPILTQVRWLKSWEGLRIAEPAKCRHPGTEVLAIGHALVPAGRGGGRRATTRATLCMLCGTDTTGRMTADEAIDACWAELGWNEAVRLRLYELANPIAPLEADPAGAER